MTTFVHKTVGVERIKQICDDHGLTAEDVKIIDQTLEEWEKLLGQNERKVSSAIQKIRNNPHYEIILNALFRIIIEFVEKRRF